MNKKYTIYHCGPTPQKVVGHAEAESYKEAIKKFRSGSIFFYPYEDLRARRTDRSKPS